jgi:hypothetical protein
VIARRILLVAAAALPTAWLTGRLVSDRYAWSQWLLWIPTPAAFAAVLGGLLVACVARPRPAARRRGLVVAWGAAAVTILVWFGAVEHHFLRGPGRRGALRLVQASVQTGKPEVLDRYAAALADLGGDVTVVSALLPPSEVHALADRLGGLDHGAVTWPFVLATSLPIVEARPLVDDGEIHVAVFRVQPPAFQRPLTIYAIDLPSQPGLGRHDLALAVRRILDGVAAEPPDVVVGDFNMTRGSVSLAAIFPGLTDAYDQAGRGYGASFHRRFPLYHLDHALLGARVRATSYELVDPGVGRHMVQVVEFERAQG